MKNLDPERLKFAAELLDLLNGHGFDLLRGRRTLSVVGAGSLTPPLHSVIGHHYYEMRAVLEARDYARRVVKRAMDAASVG